MSAGWGARRALKASLGLAGEGGDEPDQRLRVSMISLPSGSTQKAR